MPIDEFCCSGAVVTGRAGDLLDGPPPAGGCPADGRVPGPGRSPGLFPGAVPRGCSPGLLPGPARRTSPASPASPGPRPPPGTPQPARCDPEPAIAGSLPHRAGPGPGQPRSRTARGPFTSGGAAPWERRGCAPPAVTRPRHPGPAPVSPLYPFMSQCRVETFRARIMITGSSGRIWGCCIFGFPCFGASLLAELVYGTPVQAG